MEASRSAAQAAYSIQALPDYLALVQALDAGGSGTNAG